MPNIPVITASLRTLIVIPDSPLCPYAANAVPLGNRTSPEQVTTVPGGRVVRESLPALGVQSALAGDVIANAANGVSSAAMRQRREKSDPETTAIPVPAQRQAIRGVTLCPPTW
jgi:hypothetical protein